MSLWDYQVLGQLIRIFGSLFTGIDMSDIYPSARDIVSNIQQSFGRGIFICKDSELLICPFKAKPRSHCGARQQSPVCGRGYFAPKVLSDVAAVL